MSLPSTWLASLQVLPISLNSSSQIVVLLGLSCGKSLSNITECDMHIEQRRTLSLVKSEINDGKQHVFCLPRHHQTVFMNVDPDSSVRKTELSFELK